MTRSSSEIIIVFVNFSDEPSACRIGKAIVKARLAACANIYKRVRSIYKWKGKLVESHEVTVMFKTTSAKYSKLERTLKALHPYEIPEIISVRVKDGNPGYIKWVRNEVTQLIVRK